MTQVFRGEVIERFREVAGGAGRLLELHEALVAGDAAAVEAELARILSTSPSVRDLLRENSYHMLMTGLLFGVPGYGDPRSNREEGRGYYDLRIAPEGQGGRPVLEDSPGYHCRAQGAGPLRRAPRWGGADRALGRGGPRGVGPDQPAALRLRGARRVLALRRGVLRERCRGGVRVGVGKGGFRGHRASPPRVCRPR